MKSHLTILLAIFIGAMAAITPGKALACAYFDDEEMIAMKDSCQKDASKEWSCDLNRCVTTQQSKEARDDYLECATIEEESERIKCHDDYAKKYTGDLTAKEPPHMMAAGVNGVFATLMLLAGTSQSQTGGSCTSKWIVLGTGAVGVVSELYFRLVANKDLEKLRENYKKENNADPYFAQLRALEYLKEEQEALSKMAGNRKKAYMLMTAGYTIGAAMAIFEAMKPDTQKCGGKKEGASEAAPSGEGVAAGSPAPVQGGAAGLGAMMSGPAGVAIVGGIGAGLSGYMWKASSDQEKQSKENAQKVQTMIDAFKGTMAGFCPQGRDDYNEPRCYCYNANGSKNTNRTRSETCQALWAQDEKNLFVAGSNYNQNSSALSKGCMTVNGKYDQQCACKKLKNPQGENACRKVPTSTTINGIDSALSTATLAKNINGITSGEFTAADLNAANLEKLAVRANRAKNKIELQANDKLRRQNKAGIPKLNNNFIEKVIGATSKKDRSQTLAKYAPIDLKSARPTDAVFESTLQKAIDNGNLTDTSFKGGEGINSGRKKGNDFQLNLGDSSRGSKVENFMEKEYKMESSDIVNREDIPIWTIISNRYTISGLKRLFDNDLSKLEEAAQSSESENEVTP